MNQNITISEAQQLVDQWIKTYGVRYFSELTNLAILTEEVGELARHISRQYGEQSYRYTKEDMAPNGDQLKKHLADEMADVLWVLICLANQTGIDLNKAFTENMDKKTGRDKERHLQNNKLIG
jgi:NTP pyrophosphatase (non-canonical NTP hydrolase)